MCIRDRSINVSTVYADNVFPIPMVGPKGDTGPQGPTGPAGPTGPKGDTGLQGVTGPAGPQGAPGAKGATGPQGIQGVPGVTGSAGPALTCQSVNANYTGTTLTQNCPSGYLAISASCNQGADIVLHGISPPPATGGTWVGYLVPGNGPFTGVTCKLLTGVSSQINLMCCK